VSPVEFAFLPETEVREFDAQGARADGPQRVLRQDPSDRVMTRTIGLNKKLYVGNIPFTCTEADLRDLFGRHGTVTSVKVITDRETGRSRGFAFVEMEGSGADEAMRALDGSQFGGRPLKVNEAREREGGGGGGRGPGGGGGFRGGRGGGGGGGRY
jgi:RNA recognition motif-containing protein